MQRPPSDSKASASCKDRCVMQRPPSEKSSMLVASGFFVGGWCAVYRCAVRGMVRRMLLIVRTSQNKTSEYEPLISVVVEYQPLTRPHTPKPHKATCVMQRPPSDSKAAASCKDRHMKTLDVSCIELFCWGMVRRISLCRTGNGAPYVADSQSPQK